MILIGRPRKSIDRVIPVSFSIEPEFKELIDKNAHKHGISASEYISRILKANLKTTDYYLAQAKKHMGLHYHYMSLKAKAEVDEVNEQK